VALPSDSRIQSEEPHITLLDGAMGTELHRRGSRLELPLWSAQSLIDNPDLVLQIHRDYRDAGADILTTNTFRTHRRSLDKAGIGDRARAITMLAVSLAVEASDGKCTIAGSISPLEDCFRPDLSPGSSIDEFLEIGSWLLESGCDLLIIETMNNIVEMRSALTAAQRLSARCYVSVNPSTADPSKLLSGEAVREALRVAEGEGAAAFLVNCAPIPVVERAVKEIAEVSPLAFGAYANNGATAGEGRWRFDQDIDVAEFVDHSAKLVEMGARIIGGCCGTTPRHIEAIAEFLAFRRG
jgi:homocysteine S-methyltransferase